MGRWYIPFSAIDPEHTERQWTVGIEEAHYTVLKHHGHEKQIARLMLVKETLDDPIRIHKGWCRQDKEDSYVYVGKPTHDYRSLTIETPAPPGQLFLVFILPGGTIDEWTWRPVAEKTPETPQGVEGEVIWQRPLKT